MTGTIDPKFEQEVAKQGFAAKLELQESNLPERSWVKISRIRTLSAKRFRNKK